MITCLLRRKIGQYLTAGLLMMCLLVNGFHPAEAAAKTKHWADHKEYRAIIDHIKPTIAQVVLLNRIASTISSFSKLHPDIDRKIRQAARKTLASRKWNENYAKELIKLIKQSHTVLIEDIYSDLYVLHKSLDKDQKQALSNYLYQRLDNLDKEVGNQIKQAQSYGGVLGTLFVGFGSDQRSSLQALIQAVEKTYKENAAIRQSITKVVNNILQKQEINAHDVKRYLRASHEEFAAYEKGILLPIQNFLDSLDERQKGRIVYLFDDASRKQKLLVSK